MNNAGRLGALLPVCIHMAHNIMAHFFFPRFCDIIVDVIDMRFQLRNLLIRNHGLPILGKTELLFRLRQCNPQASPGAELHVR